MSVHLMLVKLWFHCSQKHPSLNDLQPTATAPIRLDVDAERDGGHKQMEKMIGLMVDVWYKLS